MHPLLSRTSLKRVVESLLRTELQTLWKREKRAEPAVAAMGCWPEDYGLGDTGDDSLGCDSLELLHLSAAVNEMFHLHEVGCEARLLREPNLGAWLNTIQEAWALGVESVTFITSGSTGLPKRCVHRFASLRVEIDHLADLFQDRARIVAFAEAKHIYSFLFTAMLPDRLGIPVEDFHRVGGEDGEASRPSFRAGDLLVAVPEVWRWLDRSFPVWAPEVKGVVSTAPCPGSTIESLMTNGLAGLTEVYGSTESAGVGVRVWPDTAYTLMPQWSRVSTGDASLQHIMGTRVTPMDRLAFCDERRFLVEGRTDGVVQVGGTNVFLSYVEERLGSIAGVAAVAVRLMRPDEGTRLKCFLVPTEGQCADILEQRVRASLPGLLLPAERPRLFRSGTALPRSTLGKLCDW